MITLTRALVLLLPTCSWLSSAALGVVITTGDGTGNTTAPPDDPGFANVGATVTQLSGVYLGDRWVLTAQHVGEEDMWFDGVLYPVIPGSQVQLLTGAIGADLAMIRLQTAPPLPAPILATAPLVAGEIPTFIGDGYPRLPDLYCWDASFIEISCPPPGPAAAHAGYKRQGGARILRWGVNEITDVDLEGPIQGRTTHYFTTTFDANGPLQESQAVTGDSGGGVFLERGGQWELVGIMFAQFVWPNQPSNTAVFGNLGTHADVYFYRQQIIDIMNPPPVIPMLPIAAWGAIGVLLVASTATMLRRR
jgi:hypothetical protein